MLNDDFHPKRPPLPFDKQYITVVNRCKAGDEKSPPRVETDWVDCWRAAISSCKLLLGGSLPEENIQKDDYLRPQRLRRSTAPNTTSSGEHSLAGGKRPKRSLPRSLVMKSKHQHFMNTQILVSDKFDLSILRRIQEPKFGQFSRQ